MKKDTNSSLVGKLIIFSGPSGVGKSTIVKSLLKTVPSLSFSISATTRMPRQGEEDGVNYHFLSLERFKEVDREGGFLEWEEVYEGVCYGTLKEDVDRRLASNQHVVLDVDVVGGLRIKEIYQNQALTVFIQPPSLEHLERRLNKRNTDSLDVVALRLQKAEKELAYSGNFEHVVVNETLDEATQNVTQLVTNFIKKS